MEKTIKDNWNDIIDFVRENYDVSSPIFRVWFSPLEIFSYNDGKLIIAIDESNQGDIKDLIDKKYRIALEVAVESITNEKVSIEFIYKENKKESERVSSYIKGENLEEKYPFLKSNHSFDTFVVTDINRIAHAASLAVSECPDGQVYNPLFLYSQPGLGKTHLMHSIARYIINNHPEKKVLYTTSEEFMNSVVDAIRTNKVKSDTSATANMRKEYRNVDVLLIDDIQFIIGKDSTQVEFFNTFESLYQSGKQLVISSDRPPNQMTELDIRYRSRFTSGSPIDIQPPDYETCMAILKNKNDESDIKLDNSILNYIATNFKTNIRDLEGAYKRIIMYAKFNHDQNITIEVAEKALSDLLDEKKNITAEYIIDMVADHFNIDKDALLSQKKTKNLTYPRFICMYLISELTTLTQQEIAIKLNRNNHTTVINGINKVINEMETNNDLNDSVKSIRKKLES